VESVERALGTKGFWRVRIGIENRQIKQLEQLEHFEHLTGEKYVLSRFTQQESEILKETVSQIAKALTEHLTD